MKNIIITLFSVLILTSTYADMNDSDKNRAWECSGTTGYTQIKPAQEGKIHATNYYRGTYTLKK